VLNGKNKTDLLHDDLLRSSRGLDATTVAEARASRQCTTDPPCATAQSAGITKKR